MPTIDATQIEGFEQMTAEQKVEALLKAEVPEKVDLSLYVPKTVHDKTSSDLADAKKQLKAKMTDEEQAKEANDSAMQELQEKYNELLKSSTIANHTARYLAMPGYDEALARETAEALFGGDMDKVFANQQKANAAYEKQIRAEKVRSEPSHERKCGSGKAEAEDAGVALAKKLGQRKNQSVKASEDIIKQYMK